MVPAWLYIANCVIERNNIIYIMDKDSELEFEEPVSPHGQYFNSSVICAYSFVFMEFAIPIDDLQIIPLLKDNFLPAINPRFSSIMVQHFFHTFFFLKQVSSILYYLTSLYFTFYFLSS
jgi:hypothetical protein